MSRRITSRLINIKDIQRYTKKIKGKWQLIIDTIDARTELIK